MTPKNQEEEFKCFAEEYALSLPGGYADHPFENDFETTVLRHGIGGKWFGLLMRVPLNRFFENRTGVVWVLNLKCAPEDSIVWQELFSHILPAYHMNKRLWISVLLTGDVPAQTLEKLIYKSYLLTKKTKKTIGQSS